MVKLFTIVAGETWNSHKTFVESLAGSIPLTEVQRVEECDVILEFCPVSSRPGPDIDTALRDIPANRPAILVVMHHTCDPNRSVFDSSKYVTQSNVVSVDCVFYEGKGFFRCSTNEEAVDKTLGHLRKYSKEPLPGQGPNLLSPQEPPPAQVQEPITQGEKEVAPGFIERFIVPVRRFLQRIFS